MLKLENIVIDDWQSFVITYIADKTILYNCCKWSYNKVASEALDSEGHFEAFPAKLLGAICHIFGVLLLNTKSLKSGEKRDSSELVKLKFVSFTHLEQQNRTAVSTW